MSAADNNKAAVDRTMEEFGGYISCLEDAHEKGVIYVINAWNKGNIRKSPAMKDAYEMGSRI